MVIAKDSGVMIKAFAVIMTSPFNPDLSPSVFGSSPMISPPLLLFLSRQDMMIIENVNVFAVIDDKVGSYLNGICRIIAIAKAKMLNPTDESSTLSWWPVQA